MSTTLLSHFENGHRSPLLGGELTLWINPRFCKLLQTPRSLRIFSCSYLWCLTNSSLSFSAKYPDPSSSLSILLALLPTSRVMWNLISLEHEKYLPEENTFSAMWETWLPVCYEMYIKFLSDLPHNMRFHHIYKKINMVLCGGRWF